MINPYKIIGVDPGTNLCGYSIVEIDNDNPKLIDFGVFNLKKLDCHNAKLREIFLSVQELIETYLPKQLAIEAPFYGKNVQSMLKLGRAQGVAMAAAITMGLEIHEYSPKMIKQSITGNGNASKEQVAKMLESILGHSLEIQHLDSTDALAAAICHYQKSSSLIPLAKSGANNWSDFIKKNPERLSQ